MRRWYAGRGISWTPLLTCCALAVAAALVARSWPETLAGLLPALVALCGAGAGFVFDEAAGTVVAVTPRGAGWRRSTRAAVALLPLGVWLTLAASLPTAAVENRGAWCLVGAGTVLLVTASAAIASRAQVAAPGSSLAGVVALGLLGPHLMSPFLGWDPLPGGPFPDSVLAFWVVLSGAGVAACAWALRPGLH